MDKVSGRNGIRSGGRKVRDGHGYTFRGAKLVLFPGSDKARRIAGSPTANGGKAFPQPHAACGKADDPHRRAHKAHGSFHVLCRKSYVLLGKSCIRLRTSYVARRKSRRGTPADACPCRAFRPTLRIVFLPESAARRLNVKFLLKKTDESFVVSGESTTFAHENKNLAR